jgi:hypothetical protein
MDVCDRLQRERERVPPSVVDFLEQRLQEELKHKTKRNHALTTREQVYKQKLTEVKES